VAQLSARSMSPSPNQILAAQHIVLEQLGDALTGRITSEDTLAISAMSRVDVQTPLSVTASTRASNLNAPYVVLDAIGALILDEDDIASSRVAAITGITVIANQQFDAPIPVTTTAAAGPNPWHRSQIGVTSGHAQTGKDVLVGVLDTGIDAKHPEFAGKTIHFSDLNAAGLQVGATARDAGDHGTHVCGIIAGVTSGVAPDADLAVAAVLTQLSPAGLSGSTVQIATGLNWLLSHPFRPNRPGVDVINASLGVGVPKGGATQTGYYPFLQQIVSNALLAPGVLIIASIGNDGLLGVGYHGSPGNYHNVVGVGATDRKDRVADFSDWDTAWVPPGTTTPISKPDLSAPGVNVVSAKPGGGYQAMSGTSMAAPVVTGVTALLLEQDTTLVGDPVRLRTELEARATATAAPFPPNLGGLGRIQV
jgi:subtilisin family serine protease